MSSNRRNSPWQGLWIILPILIAVPLAVYFLFHYLLDYYVWPQWHLNEATARVLGFGSGLVFHLCCLISGAFTRHRRALTNRLKDLFMNWRLGPGFALGCYWDDLKEDGCVFTILLLVMAAFAIGLADAVRFLLRFL